MQWDASKLRATLVFARTNRAVSLGSEFLIHAPIPPRRTADGDGAGILQRSKSRALNLGSPTFTSLPSGSLIRIGNELVADTTTIAQEDRMAKIAVRLVLVDDSKAHRP